MSVDIYYCDYLLIIEVDALLLTLEVVVEAFILAILLLLLF